jgi:hypothetical protein
MSGRTRVYTVDFIFQTKCINVLSTFHVNFGNNTMFFGIE